MTHIQGWKIGHESTLAIIFRWCKQYKPTSYHSFQFKQHDSETIYHVIFYLPKYVTKPSEKNDYKF